MKDLRKDYNRKYYRARVKIWVNLQIRLARASIAAKFLKWAYKADREKFAKVVLDLSRNDDWMENEAEHFSDAL